MTVTSVSFGLGELEKPSIFYILCVLRLLTVVPAQFPQSDLVRATRCPKRKANICRIRSFTGVLVFQ